MRPPARHQRLRLRRSGVSGDEARAPQLVRAQHRHLAGVGVRSPGFGEGVVAVVPHHHQPEIGDRGEHRAAGADDEPGLPPQDGEPPTVPLGGAEPGGQRDHGAVVDVPDRGRVQRVDVALVGHDGQRRTAGPDDDRGGLRQPVGPLLPRECLPHRAGRTALAERVEEVGAAPVGIPAGRIHGLRGRGGDLGRRLLLHVGVARRNRQPQDVGAGARIPGRHGIDQPTDVLGQHALAGHDPVQPAEFALVVCLRPSLQDEGVDQPAVEAHPGPDPRLGVVGLLGGHQVVELAVEVGHRQHGQHPGDRLVLGRLPDVAHGGGVAERSDTWRPRPKKNPAVISSSDAA